MTKKRERSGVNCGLGKEVSCYARARVGCADIRLKPTSMMNPVTPNMICQSRIDESCPVIQK